MPRTRAKNETNGTMSLLGQTRSRNTKQAIMPTKLTVGKSSKSPSLVVDPKQTLTRRRLHRILVSFPFRPLPMPPPWSPAHTYLPSRDAMLFHMPVISTIFDRAPVRGSSGYGYGVRRASLLPWTTLTALQHGLIRPMPLTGNFSLESRMLDLHVSEWHSSTKYSYYQQDYFMYPYSVVTSYGVRIHTKYEVLRTNTLLQKEGFRKRGWRGNKCSSFAA